MQPIDVRDPEAALPLVSSAVFPMPRLLSLAVLLLSLAIGCMWLWLTTRVPLDDAHIYFRYAINFLKGRGLVYNVGDPVEGYTSFTWMIIVLLGGLGRFPLDKWSQSLSAIFYLLNILLLWRVSMLSWPEARCSRFLPLLLFCASPASAIWAGMALETAFFSFLLTLLVFEYLRPSESKWHTAWVSVLGCTLALTRPEGILFYATLVIFELLWSWLKLRRLDLSSVVLLSLGLILYALFLCARYHAYGFILPNTYYVKVGHSLLSYYNGLKYLLDYLNGNSLHYFFVILVLLTGLIYRPDKRWCCITTILLCHGLIVVQSGGNNWPFWRYAVPASALLAWWTSSFFIQGLLANRGRSWICKATRGCLYFWICAIAVNSSNGVLCHPQLKWLVEGNQSFKKVATFYGGLFSALLSPRDSIALSPIPFVGYFYDGYVYDMLGLTDRTIAHRSLPLGTMVHSHEKGDGKYVLAMRPTIIRTGGGLEFSSSPERAAQSSSDLYFRSDRELFALDEFHRLYAPYSILIPKINSYAHFYALRNITLREVASSDLDRLYNSTVDQSTQAYEKRALESVVRLAQDSKSLWLYRVCRDALNQIEMTVSCLQKLMSGNA